MSKIALVRLGPCATLGLLTSDAAKRTLYCEDVRMLPHKPTPVVLDHDDDQQVGEVLEVFPMHDWVPDGVKDARSIAARIRLDGHAPTWIGRGTGASISCWPGHINDDFFGWQRVSSAVLREVTLCSATEPMEPLAQILTIRDEVPNRVPRPGTAAARPRRPARAPHASVTHWAIGHRPRSGHEETEELNARLDLAERAGLPAAFEQILEQLKTDLGYTTAPWKTLAA